MYYVLKHKYYVPKHKYYVLKHKYYVLKHKYYVPKHKYYVLKPKYYAFYTNRGSDYLTTEDTKSHTERAAIAVSLRGPETAVHCSQFMLDWCYSGTEIGYFGTCE